MPAATSRGCLDFLRAKCSRRRLLQVGALGLTGLSLSRVLQAEARVTRNASAIDFPHPGSIVASLTSGQPRAVPPFVSLPTMIADGPFRTPGEFAGFLGKMYDPLWVLQDPNAADFNFDELTLPSGVD